MTGKNLKQLFKALNDFNNLQETLHQSDCNLDLRIYIDDELFYYGTSYKAFLTKLKEEFVKDFVNEVINILFCGNNIGYIDYKDEYTETKTKIEIYVA